MGQKLNDVSGLPDEPPGASSPVVPPDPANCPTNCPTGAVCGVYLLFLGRQLVYVGRSRNCAARIAQHRTNGRPFDHYQITPCSPADALWIEQALIAATDAVQNKQRPAPPVRRAEPAPDPAEHPLMQMNKTAARQRVKRFGLSREFEDALAKGELPFRLRNPESPRPGAPMVIDVGELLAWCERTRLAAQNQESPSEP